MGVANSMSLFFAHATPMLQSLSGATSRYVVDKNVQVLNSSFFHSFSTETKRIKYLSHFLGVI